MHKTLIALFSVVLLASSPQSQAADDPGNTLRIYNWADYIGDTTLADFEKATGIKVIYDTYDSYETVQGKLLSGRSGYDLALLNASLVPLLIKGKVFQPLDKSLLPDWNNLDPLVLKSLEAHDPGVTYSAPYTWGSNGVTYNVDMIKARMPDAPVGSLAMIFDPKIVSRFADCGITFMDSPTDMIPLALTYLGLDPNSAAPKDLKAAQEVLMAVRPYIRKFDSSGFINGLGHFLAAKADIRTPHATDRIQVAIAMGVVDVGAVARCDVQRTLFTVFVEHVETVHVVGFVGGVQLGVIELGEESRIWQSHGIYLQWLGLLAGLDGIPGTGDQAHGGLGLAFLCKQALQRRRVGVDLGGRRIIKKNVTSKMQNDSMNDAVISRKMQAFEMTAGSANVNAKMREEMIFRDVGKMPEHEIALLMDPSTDTDKETMAEVSSAIQEIVIRGKKPSLNYNADLFFLKRLEDFAIKHQDTLSQKKFNLLMECMQEHEEIALGNAERHAKARVEQEMNGMQEEEMVPETMV